MTEFDTSGGKRTSSQWMRTASMAGTARCMAVLCVFVFSSMVANAKTIYVNAAASGAGNGTSWAFAFKYLQDALGIAVPGDSIYLAKGTYYPDDSENNEDIYWGDREVSFVLDRVKIYGGFKGNETGISQRKIKENPTILSGEIWEVTPETPGYERYWSLHVVLLAGDATLDALTIQKGRANGDELPANSGGGCYVPDGFTLTLRDCKLTENLACFEGGAVAGNVNAENCVFSNNLVDNEFLKCSSPDRKRAWLFHENCSGGAIRGDVTATNCRFWNNRVVTAWLETLPPMTSSTGGAIAGAIMVLTECRFTNNVALVTGGAGMIPPTSAATGGAISATTLDLQKCLFKDNAAQADAGSNGNATATALGGAVKGTVSASRCTFDDNEAKATSSAGFSPNPAQRVPFTAAATAHGGAIMGQVKATNCSFANNKLGADGLSGDRASVDSQGGAIREEGESSVMNCTFTENQSIAFIDDANVDGVPINGSNDSGGAIHNTGDLVISNCTFFDNAAGAAAALFCGGNVRTISSIYWYSEALIEDEMVTRDSMIHVAGRGRISNRMYPTPSTETKNILRDGYVDGVVRYLGANLDFGDPPERTILDMGPRFFDWSNPVGEDGIWGTFDDGLRLKTGSPAIGLGHLLFIPPDTFDLDGDGNIEEDTPIDILGFVRVQNKTLDLGAYEYGGKLYIPDIVVEEPEGTDLTDGESIVDFGYVQNPSTTKTLTIRNVGPNSLNNLNVSISGDVSYFSFTQPPVTSLGFNQSTTFTVTFTPKGKGSREIALKIASDDPNENPFDLIVRGKFYDADIAVEHPVGTDLKDGVAVVNFGKAERLKPATKTFTILNTGKAPLNVLSVASSGANASEFKVTQSTKTIIDPGDTATFEVTLTPTTVGSKTALITIMNNDPDAESTFTFTVNANAITSPEIEVAQPAGNSLVDGGVMSYGKVKIGLTYTKTFTITNTGLDSLRNIAVSLSGSSRFSVTQPAVSVLRPNARTTFTLVFRPINTTRQTATLNIASNDVDENPFNLALDGTGIPATAAPSNLAAVLQSSMASPPGGLGNDDGVVSVMNGANGLKYLMLTVPKPVGPGVVGRTVEVSPNLVDWFSGDKHTTTLRDDASVLKVRDNTPVKAGEKRYIRLK